MMEMTSDIIRSSASSSRTASARASRRLPRGIGLSLAGLASIGLWFAFAYIVTALMDWASVFGTPA